VANQRCTTPTGGLGPGASVSEKGLYVAFYAPVGAGQVTVGDHAPTGSSTVKLAPAPGRLSTPM
jgi:hypothetical protein